VYRADPLNPQSLVFLGDAYLFSRRYDEAERAYERALELERDYRPAVASLADVFERMGRDADAAAWRSRLLMLRGEQDLVSAFDDVREREGARAAIRWLDRRNLEEFQRSPDEHLWGIAYTHARLGNVDAAILFLQRAYERRAPGLLQARVDPDLDGLRTDPRFTELLDRIGPR
jgi:tetratricopeptide (TPR) repeat protein